MELGVRGEEDDLVEVDGRENVAKGGIFNQKIKDCRFDSH